MDKICVPCRRLNSCTTFGDFTIVNPSDKLYINQAQNLVVTCPDGSQPTVMIPAGVIGFVLNFQLGTAPYPNLVLNVNGTPIVVPVPDSTTQAQLDALIRGLLNTAAGQIAKELGCQPGTFYNAQQQFTACQSHVMKLMGALASGVTSNAPSNPGIVTVASGTVSSNVSQADADGKALQLAMESFYSGQVVCCGS